MNINRNAKIALVAALVTVIIAVISGSVFIQSTDFKETEQTASEKQGLSGTVSIGGILPLTGGLSIMGEDNKIAAQLAVEDFNRHLAEINSKWDLHLIVENSEANPPIALEKVMNLHAKDINVIVGPASSSVIHNVKGYSDSNDILLFSPTSSAAELAIAGDNVFRFVPDDRQLGPVIAGMIHNEGIKVIVPLWRGDVWGDGLKTSTEKSLIKQGNIIDDGVRYSPEAAEFSASISLLAEKVQNYIKKYGTDKVAVLVLGFAETQQIMQSASQYDMLDDVRWFGADSVAKDSKLVDDPISLLFAQKTQFTAPQITYPTNQIRQHIDEYSKTKFGRTLVPYAYSSYDIVWLIGLAINQTESTDTYDLREVIPEIAKSYQGAIGSTALNDAGDLVSADFDIWQIKNGEWVLVSKYQKISSLR